MNHRLATIAVAVSLLAACSGDDNAVTDATSSAAATTSSSTSTSGSGVAPITSTTNAAPTTSSPTAAVTTTSDSVSPPVAEANGWRFVVTQPVPRSTIGTKPLVCYEASGTSREPLLVLEVQVIDAATGSVVVDERRDINVGRGGIEFDLSAIAPGSYRLTAGLSVDGAPPGGLTLQIPDLTLVAGTTAVPCE